MLSWSAEETGRTVDLGHMTSDGDIGIAGGPELVALGRASIGPESDPGPAAAVARVLGGDAAIYAAGVAANFELMNRAVDAAGLPVGRVSRERLAHIIEALEMDTFPHAAV
jgi:hypothetical protein